MLALVPALGWPSNIARREQFPPRGSERHSGYDKTLSSKMHLKLYRPLILKVSLTFPRFFHFQAR